MTSSLASVLLRDSIRAHWITPQSIRKDGFTNVRVLTKDTEFHGTRVSPTGGQRGEDRTMAVAGDLMGKVMGMVFQCQDHRTG